MKNMLIFISCITVVIASDVSQSFEVKGMICDYACVNKVKEVVNSLEGVKSCEVDFRQSKLTVSFDEEKLDPDTIIESLTEKTTFKTSILEQGKKESFWSKIKSLFSKS